MFNNVISFSYFYYSTFEIVTYFNFVLIIVIILVYRSFWYIQRQSVFEEFFIDLLSGLKAAYLAENFEDIICRLTKELFIFFELYAALERWPLINSRSNFAKVIYFLLN